jgi:hypothetical protein
MWCASREGSGAEGVQSRRARACCIIILACSLRQRAEDNRDQVSLVWAVPSSPGLLTHRTSVFSVAVSRPKPPNKWPSQGFQFSAFFFLFTLFFGGTELGPLYTRSLKAKAQLKSSIPIDAKVEISPKGLYTGSQGQGSTQIKHSYWCKSWNQPQGALH